MREGSAFAEENTGTLLAGVAQAGMAPRDGPGQAPYR
jgi:hypothetical protein